jgi:hypothetical protein
MSTYKSKGVKQTMKGFLSGLRKLVHPDDFLLVVLQAGADGLELNC